VGCPKKKIRTEPKNGNGGVRWEGAELEGGKKHKWKRSHREKAERGQRLRRAFGEPGEKPQGQEKNRDAKKGRGYREAKNKTKQGCKTAGRRKNC